MDFKLLHLLAFLGALAVGCVLVYMSPVEHKTVFVYPTPSNSKKIQYMDSTGSCFGFTQTEVQCNGKEKSIPAQV
jgi:hypothetical protein